MCNFVFVILYKSHLNFLFLFLYLFFKSISTLKKKKKIDFHNSSPQFFFSHFITIFLSFQIGIVGHKNLNKVPVPCVVSMAEESIIVPRRSHARTVRPRPWHVTRESHTIKKKFRRRGQPWHDWRDGGHSHI